MTVEEAKKVLEMCTDTIKKINDDHAEYINKEYVLKVLDMIEPQTMYPWPDPQIVPWNPNLPGVTWTDKFVYKKTSDGTGDEATGKWVQTDWPNPKPYEPSWMSDSNSGQKPPEFGITTSRSSKEDVNASIDTSEPTHQFKETFTTTGPIKESY